MPGFLFSNISSWRYPQYEMRDDFLTEVQSDGKWFFFRSTLRKFQDDKLFRIEPQYAVILEGCLLNKRKLMTDNRVNSLYDLIIKLYDDGKNETFFNAFRGPFCGALYDRRKNKWYIFTNHTGEKCVYYYSQGSNFIVSTDLDWIYNFCSKNQLSLSADENGVYQMLTFGYMEDDSTLAKEIKRVGGGTYLEIYGCHAGIKRYHTFIKDEKMFENCSESELIDIIDRYFMAAVKMEFDKDVEYGYRHIGDISGGLDSRMNIWAAHELGFHDLQLITYCKADYLDEQIAKEIASHWKDSLLIRPLDDLKFMFDIDRNISLNGGTSLYIGITGGIRLLDMINWKKFGIEHTGMIGDAVLGCFAHRQEALKRGMPSGKYSEKFSNRLLNSGYHDSFYDHEIYLQYTRCFKGAANTMQMRNAYTEVWSPFMDPDFLQVCMNIPVALRGDHRIYKKWILCKHPSAALYKWEKLNGLITDSKIKLGLRKLVKRGPAAFLRKVGIDKYSSNVGMNPLDYWFETNTDISDYMEEYFESCADLCGPLLTDNLKRDLADLFQCGNVLEKCMVLTAYGTLKKMFKYTD